jgi:hypothetical protein
MKARTTIILSLLICAFAIPASASGSDGTTPDQGSTASDASGLAQRTPTELGQRTQADGLAQRTPTELGQRSQADGLAQRTPTELGQSSQFAFSPSVAPSSSDGFDWGDAALGAGAAMALIALGGVGLRAMRRRTPVSPSVSTG